MKRRNTSFAALIALLALVSCSSDSKSSSTSAAAAATSTTAVAAATTAPAGETTVAPATGDTAAGGESPMTATVDIKQFKFGPAETKIAVGGTVTWTNSDNQKHTATSSGGFDTGAIEGGATGMATFDTAGTFAYICSFHPFMKGTVIVG